MSVTSDEINGLLAKISAVTTKAANKIKGVPALVDMADNTLKLGGKDYNTVRSDGQAIGQAHIARLDNPHGITPAILGAYTSDESTHLVDYRLPVGVAPIDVLGSQDYLPLGVSGDFVGATQYMTRGRCWYIEVEADGTLVYLRNGTNGSKIGVYYSYSKNAFGATLTSPSHTATPYAPPGLPSNRTVAYIYHCRRGLLVGRLQDSSGVLQECFAVYTNNTLDQNQHTGFAILPAAWDTNFTNAEILSFNGNVYVLKMNSIAYTDAFEFTVHQLVPSTTSPTLTQVTGWTCTGWKNSYSASNTLKLGGRLGSATAADNPYIFAASGMPDGLNPSHIGMGWPRSNSSGGNGKIRSLVFFETAMSYVSTGAGAVVSNCISFTWDPISKVAAVDVGYQGQTPLTMTVNGANIVASGPANKTRSDLGMYNNGDSTFHMIFTTDGWQFSFEDSYYPDTTVTLTRAKVDNWTQLYDALYPLGNNSRSGRTWVRSYPRYGSAFGSSFLGMTPWPGNKVMGYAQTNLGATSGLGLVIGKVPTGSPNYTYSSISPTRPTIQGFAPDPDRKLVADVISNAFDVAVPCVQVTADNNIRAFGSVLWDGWRLSRPLEFDTNLGSTGTISVTQAQCDALKTQILTALGLQNDTAKAVVEIIIPQTATIPAYANIQGWRTSNRRPFYALVQIDVSGRSGAIATVNYNKVLYQNLNFADVPIDSLANNGDVAIFMGGHMQYETADGWICIVPTSRMWLANTLGWATNYLCRFYVDKSTSAIDMSSIAATTTFYYGESLRWFCWPGQGVGQITNLMTTDDSHTKIVFDRLATTKAQYMAWSTILSSIVIASQDVAQGWIVYFTEDCPLVVHGKKFTLAAGNINLTSIQANPANTTFHLYAMVTGNLATWVVQTTKDPAETWNKVYIGTIITGTSGINSISVAKSIRFANRILSQTKRGLSIPVSTGHPANPSTHWK